MALHNSSHTCRQPRGQISVRASLLARLLLLTCGALLVVAMLWPVARVGAQSGRKRAAPSNGSPQATPTPSQQRRRRASPSSMELPPVQTKRTETAAPVNAPQLEAPPPWPTPTPKPTPPSAAADTEAGEEIDEADVVRISSNLVTVPASVVDAQGRAVIDLKLEDFELRVDGQPREISELGRSETPVRIVMLFDNSMSLAAAREFEKRAAIRFFRNVLRPIDQAAIYSIWTIPVFVQGFTSDVRTLVRTVENFAHPEDGATALFDTVAQAADYLRPYADRKVIIIVSDGADTLSNLDFLTSLKRVMTADVQVYAVQTGHHDNANLYNLSAHHRLQEYASQTGGAVYIPRSTHDLDNAFAQISADLSQQYVLSYYPQDARNDGRFRTISLRVKTRQNMRVRARKGYYDRTGQRQAFTPVESMKVTVNQPENTRSEPTANVSPAATTNNASNGLSRRDMTQMTARSTTRRTSSSRSVGPDGPDDEPERPERAERRPEPIPEMMPAKENSSGQANAGSTSTPAPAPKATPTPAPPPKATSSPTPSTNSSATNSSSTPSPAPKKPLSGGVLNGKAVSLPKPVYPATAKSLRTTGTVVVEVTIDESGKVVSARAVSGPLPLQNAAVQAARMARFSPTTLSGQPVQVVGLITYSFAAP